MANVDEIIKPSDCFFGMCLPITKEDFLDSLKENCNKHYSKIRRRLLQYNPEALWELDHLPLVNLFLAKKAELEKLGVTFCTNFSTKDLKLIKDFKIATIFAHHEDDRGQVELYDGLQTIDTITAHMPNDYDKILDLTMCRSISLQTELRKSFQNCIVVANKLETNAEFRLLCYGQAILILHKENMNYIDAIAKVRMQLKKSIPQKDE